jgi:hypothetical protein
MTFHHRPSHDVGFRLTSGDDWRALLLTRANMMITGPSAALEAFLTAAHPHLREPLRRCDCSKALVLDDVATLILTDVDALDDGGQQQLLRWLTAADHDKTQILSLSSEPIRAPGPANRLTPDLFYRLNTIRIDVQHEGS